MSRYGNLIRTQWNTPPNIITGARLIGAFVVLWLMLTQQYPGATVLFVFVAATDWVDGWVAKRNNGKWITELGKLIDPLVDKVLIACVFTGLIVATQNATITIVAALIVARELIVTWSKRVIINSTGTISSAIQASRFSMMTQSVACGVLLLSLSYESWQTAGLHLLLVGLGTSLASGWAYYADARKATQKRS